MSQGGGGPSFEDLLVNKNDFEKESFSFIRQLVDLRNFCVRVIDFEEEYDQVQVAYMMRITRDQCVKLRKFLLSDQSNYGEREKRERLTVCSKCLIFVLTRLNFLFTKLDGVESFNGFSQAETRFIEEYQRDEGLYLDYEDRAEERENLSPFARSISNVSDEPCSCDAPRRALEHEGAFFRVLLEQRPSSKPLKKCINDFCNFLDKIAEEKSVLDSGDFVCPKKVSFHLTWQFNFDGYFKLCKNSEEDDLLNQFLLALCLLLTRRTFFYACCSAREEIARTSVRLELQHAELFSDCAFLGLL